MHLSYRILHYSQVENLQIQELIRAYSSSTSTLLLQYLQYHSKTFIPSFLREKKQILLILLSSFVFITSFIASMLALMLHCHLTIRVSISYKNYYSRCKGLNSNGWTLSANGCTIKRNHRGRQTRSGIYACSRMRHACASSSIYKYTYASGKISVDRYLVPVASRPFIELLPSKN